MSVSMASKVRRIARVLLRVRARVGVGVRLRLRLRLRLRVSIARLLLSSISSSGHMPSRQPSEMPIMDASIVTRRAVLAVS